MDILSELETGHLLIPIIAAVVWIVRLESKAEHGRRRLDRVEGQAEKTAESLRSAENMIHSVMGRLKREEGES